jgi:hypothetical protein
MRWEKCEFFRLYLVNKFEPTLLRLKILYILQRSIAIAMSTPGILNPVLI